MQMNTPAFCKFKTCALQRKWKNLLAMHTQTEEGMIRCRVCSGCFELSAPSWVGVRWSWYVCYCCWHCKLYIWCEVLLHSSECKDLSVCHSACLHIQPPKNAIWKWGCCMTFLWPVKMHTVFNSSSGSVLHGRRCFQGAWLSVLSWEIGCGLFGSWFVLNFVSQQFVISGIQQGEGSFCHQTWTDAVIDCASTLCYSYSFALLVCWSAVLYLDMANRSCHVWNLQDSHARIGFAGCLCVVLACGQKLMFWQIPQTEECCKSSSRLIVVPISAVFMWVVSSLWSHDMHSFRHKVHKGSSTSAVQTDVQSQHFLPETKANFSAFFELHHHAHSERLRTLQTRKIGSSSGFNTFRQCARRRHIT